MAQQRTHCVLDSQRVTLFARVLAIALGVMKRGIKLLIVTLVLLPAAAWSYYLVREARADSTFRNAELGQSEAEILARLGQPDEVLSCGEYLWWSGDQANPQKNDGRCKKWVRYNFFLHAFAFGYSGDSKLVSRYEYSSE